MFVFNSMPNLSNMSYATSYCVGLATLPLSIAVSEVATRIGKAFKLVSTSYLQRTAKNWQTQDNSFAAAGDNFLTKQVKLFLTNQLTPLFEELLTKKVVQELVLTKLPELLGLNSDKLGFVVCRVVLVSISFGLCHMKEYEAGIFSKINDEKISIEAKLMKFQKFLLENRDEINDNRNFTIIHSIARSLLWSALYEASNQNLVLAWGAHASINYFADFTSVKF